MANILGSLYVELKANTAAFVQGMSGASYAAKQAGRDIEGAFSKLGSVAGSLLSPFGQIGGAISETFSRVAEFSGAATEGISRLAGGMSPLAVGAGAAVAAIGAVEVGAVALAMHTVEAVAKFDELSQSTGISTEVLSGFGFVAKQSGVDSETMIRGLERMSKSAFAAATAAPGTTNAYTRLGIAVQDSAGNLRGVDAIFGDVAARFAEMPDGVAKTALAIQIFGRGGAALIPILNQGRDGIQGFLETAQALGIVIDEQTAEAAHRFEQSLNTIEAAGQGVSIQLLKSLLPAFQAVGDFLVSGLRDKSSGLNTLLEGVTKLIKGTIALGQTIWTAFQQIGLAIKHVGADILNTVAGAWDALKRGDVVGFFNAISGHTAEAMANQQLFMLDSRKLWADNKKFIDDVFAPPKEITPRKRTGPGPDVTPAKEDTVLARIKERILALEREASEWFKVGEAGSQAEVLIAEANKKGADEYGRLRAEAARSKTPEALRFVEQNEQAIEAAAAAGVYGQAVKSLTTELDKQGLTLKEQESAAMALAGAYREGGNAIATAAIDREFAKQSAELSVLSDVHSRLAGQLGLENPLVQFLASAIELETKKLNENEAARRRVLAANLSAELAKEASDYQALAPFVAAVSEAHLAGADAVRGAAVELQLQTWEQEQLGKGIVLTNEQIEQQRRLLRQKADDAYANSIKEEAARYNLLLSYSEEITKLERIRAVLVENGTSTLQVDAAIYDATERTIRQWDQAAMKVGSLQDKFRAMMNELALQGNNLGGKIFEAFGKAIDDVSTQLAKLVVTGKANFKQLFESLEESIVKATIQKGISMIAGWVNKTLFGGAIPGLGPKADGSQANPFYVIPTDGSGNVLGAIAGAAGGGEGSLGGILGGATGGEGEGEGGGGGLFGGIFSKLGGVFGKIFSTIGSIIGKIASGIGSFFSGIFSFFGGFLASGGDVTPGKAYVVGEKHPEFFVPRQPGHVAPALAMSAPQQTILNFHVNGVRDFDSFQRSRSQIMADLQMQLAIAHTRNR